MTEPEKGQLPPGTVAALLIAAAQTPLGSTMIAVALPSISAELEVELPLATGLLVTSYIILNLICQGPGGKLSDAIGRWRVVEIGMLLFSLGAILGALAGGIWVLTAGRLLMAVGGALTMPSTLAILRGQTGARNRGKIFGLYSATQSLAAAIGPALGGELVQAFGWRAIFFVNVPLIVVAALLARVSGRPPATTARTRTVRDVVLGFDWAGTVLLALSLVGLGLAATWTLAIAAVAAVGFVAWELRARDPLVHPKLFRNRIFAAACLAIMLQSFMMYGMMFQLPQFFETVRGASPRDTGHLLLVMMLALLVASLAGGTLSDRLGPRLVCLGGVVLMAAGCGWLWRLDLMTATSDAFGGILLVGLGLGIAWPPAQATAMSAVEEARSGMAAGATSTGRYLGGTIGILMFSAVVAHGGGAAVSAHRTVMAVFLVAVVMSGICCLGLPSRSRPTKLSK